MNRIPELVISCILAYLLGSISGGILTSRLANGPDLRTVGSKNTGASNVQRTMGWKYGLITFFFDAVYTWTVTVALAFVLTRYTDWDIITIYMCVQFIDILKVVIGLIMLRSDFWARNVVNDAD